MQIADGIADSVAYLSSDAALASIAVDPYWPKWHSPWWHMLLLHELGEARQIPRRTADAMVAGVDRLLHIFPLHPTEAPGADLQRDIACHCALGCMAGVLASAGIDVNRALPWIEPWFVRYQMVDGGLSCDETAYRVTGECPSSMVGTIASLEAMLLGSPASWSPSRRAFVDRVAQFLVGRLLTQGSATAHNAEERATAASWTALAFPRFYFYDVLRGLTALVRWAELTGHPLPRAAVAAVVDGLEAKAAPDGALRVERHAHGGRTSIAPTADRSPSPRMPATSFPLLEIASSLGAASPALTAQWSAARAGLVRLAAAGRLV